jgi:hypothetical protein
VKSLWRFATAAGLIRGVLAGMNIPTKEVQPLAWKKGVFGAEAERDKEAAVAYVQKVYPGGLHPAYAPQQEARPQHGRGVVYRRVWAAQLYVKSPVVTIPRLCYSVTKQGYTPPLHICLVSIEFHPTPFIEFHP